MTAPANDKLLRQAVVAAAARRGIASPRLQYTIASTIVLQMVPDGAAKGGGAIRQRVGESEARLTKDLDFARPSSMTVDAFEDAFNDRLAVGWHGFTGVLRRVSKASPAGVPAEYLMDPFEVKLRYLGNSYCTVIFELGHSEIDSTDEPVMRLGTDIAAIFSELGLPEPAPVPVMSAEHQIAQKIHACTGPDAGGRAHDLVDIQILAAAEDIDVPAVGRIGPRLFAYRRRHEWPPTIVASEGWNELYAAARTDLENDVVLADIGVAIDVVNNLIVRSVEAQGTADKAG